MVTSISDQELQALTQAILNRHGIDFTCYEPKSLKRRVVRAISTLGCSSIHELWVKILRDASFIHIFMNEISVGLTTMFRDPIAWKTLKRIVQDQYKEKSISVWHAGCSTGEEVYSFGILLNELNLSRSATALATDISNEAIAHARQGIYHKIKVLDFEKNYKEFNPFSNLTKYIQREGDNARFDSALISHVDFKYHNLISDSFTGKFDFIFCRNVMIYFDNQAKVKLIEKFHSMLKPNGYFVVGFFDAVMPLIQDKQFEVVDADSKIFKAKSG